MSWMRLQITITILVQCHINRSMHEPVWRGNSAISLLFKSLFSVVRICFGNNTSEKCHNNETHKKHKKTLIWREISVYNEIKKYNINKLQEARRQTVCIHNIYLTVLNSFSPLAGSITLKININTKRDNL